jgi:DNA polymerase-1
VHRWLASGKVHARLVMQVHDELVLEVPEAAVEAVERGLRERMAAAAELKVPLRVDVGRGPHWDAAH